jgi:hypothetical protein
MLSTFKRDLLKISVDLQTAFAAEARLAGGQWLKERLNAVKLRMFGVGTPAPTVDRPVRQHLAELYTSKWQHIACSDSGFHLFNKL